MTKKELIKLLDSRRASGQHPVGIVENEAGVFSLLILKFTHGKPCIVGRYRGVQSFKSYGVQDYEMEKAKQKIFAETQKYNAWVSEWKSIQKRKRKTKSRGQNPGF